MRIVVSVMLVSLCITMFFSCTKDDVVEAIDSRSFVSDAESDFFINRDGTIDLTVTGEFKDGSSTLTYVLSRGFVYGTSSKTEVDASNTVVATGANPVMGYIKNLPKDQTYYVRGYFEMSDDTYFYGNEIQVSTSLDASNSRSIKMEMKSSPFWRSSTELTAQADFSELLKEVPVEVGFEYSLNSDFTNSVVKLSSGFTGDHQQGVMLTNWYQEVISGLTPATAYYFRPYAKYADGTVTNGGTSTASYSTSAQ